jgi:hypothetical protein
MMSGLQEMTKPFQRRFCVASDNEIKLYIEARNRALARNTEGLEFDDECTGGFTDGLRVKPTNPSWLLPETNDGFSRICGLLTVLQAKKGKSYAASWQKRGMQGAFTNLQRKYDRIDTIVNYDGDHPPGGESLTSQLADMAVYAILMLSLQAQLNPVELEQWLQEIHNL